MGDTVVLHEGLPQPIEQRRVEAVVNGQVVYATDVPADDQLHDLVFNVPVAESSWVALRQFPQLHTNPVNVILNLKPIRASRRSALWAIACIEQLWRVRARRIAPAERAEAEQAYEAAKAIYRQIAAESPSGE